MDRRSMLRIVCVWPAENIFVGQNPFDRANHAATTLDGGGWGTYDSIALHPYHDAIKSRSMHVCDTLTRHRP